MGQQTKSTKSKPRKRRNDGGNRVVFIIAAVLMVIYLGGRLSNAFSAAPETTPALHVTVNDSFTSDGWFFRDEEPIDNATGSSVKHIVYSGERVQQDAPLAIIYSDQESMDLSRQLDPLEERISLLDTALQSTSDSSNIAKLDQVITLTIEQLAEQVKEGSGSRSLPLPQASLRHAVRCAARPAMLVPTRYLPNRRFGSDAVLARASAYRPNHGTHCILVRIFLRGSGWIREHSHTILTG